MQRKTKVEKALAALDGVIEIAKREQLEQGVYIDNARDEKLAAEGAICGGHKACLLGSLWLGYGIKREVDDGWVDLPGVRVWEREAFLRHRPGLRLAYDTLNEIALPRLRRLHDNPNFVPEMDSAAEELFESGLNLSRYSMRTEVIRLCEKAKRHIEANA